MIVFHFVFVVGGTSNTSDTRFTVGRTIVEVAQLGLGPAKASAHFSDVVVVAHEELIVVHIVDVVGVHNTVLVGAGKRETMVGGANVGATWVKGAETLLGKCRTLDTVRAGVFNNVASTFLAGTEEAGTCRLASTGLGARAPGGPLGHFAVLWALINVAVVGLGEVSTWLATVCRGYLDAAVTSKDTTTASLGACSVASPG